jgi:outer membrane lipoprotein SlyB
MRSDAQASMTLLAASLACGCATSSSPPPISSTQGTTLLRIGQVTNIRDVTVRGGSTSGVGSFVGAALGAVAGSQIGSGYGSAAAAVGGALAGGIVGQHFEHSSLGSRTTELSVRFDNGDVRNYQIEPGESFRVGDTVRVITNAGVTRITH